MWVGFPEFAKLVFFVAESSRPVSLESQTPVLKTEDFIPRRCHFARLFPHFVICGDSHLGPDEKTIVETSLVVDDATTLFYDFDAFGLLTDARPFIDAITEANAKLTGRKIPTGPKPEILYFTGKKQIFVADTAIGKVSASNNPLPTSFGGPKGLGLKNTIFVTIEFKEALAFEGSIGHTSTLVRYLGLLAGRPQNILALHLLVNSGQQSPLILRVHWSMPPKRESSEEGREPQPSDVLLDAVRQPDDFSRVLANWLDREPSWRDARFRFSNSFANQNRYTIDRLIGSANMFDVLPSTAVPSVVPMSKEVDAAKEEARKAFLALPLSPERDSVLNELGRIGKSTSKQKIRYRASKIVSLLGHRFPEILMVTDEAVNCRNYHIHGGKPRFDYNGHFDTVTFFTDALEFVFATSDLIEAGWDAETWSNVPTKVSHPFARFRVSYFERLQRLKALLPP